MKLTSKDQPIGLEEKIHRMKAQANDRREQRQKTGGWILVLIALGTMFALIAGWATEFAGTAESLRTP